MIVTPALAVLASTVLLGGWLGAQYLMGVRNNRVLVGVHFILGAIGLEVLVQLLRGAPGGLGVAGNGGIAALLLAGAMLTGLLVPILAASRPPTIGATIALHATVATLGFGLLVVWALA